MISSRKLPTELIEKILETFFPTGQYSPDSTCQLTWTVEENGFVTAFHKGSTQLHRDFTEENHRHLARDINHQLDLENPLRNSGNSITGFVSLDQIKKGYFVNLIEHIGTKEEILSIWDARKSSDTATRQKNLESIVQKTFSDLTVKQKIDLNRIAEILFNASLPKKPSLKDGRMHGSLRLSKNPVIQAAFQMESKRESSDQKNMHSSTPGVPFFSSSMPQTTAPKKAPWYSFCCGGDKDDQQDLQQEISRDAAPLNEIF